MTTEYSPCVGSGECCKARPCGYGKWNEKRTQCAHLVEAYKGKVTIYRCGIHDYIIKQPGHEFMPAFGAGCTRTLFNEPRADIIWMLREGVDSGAARTLGRAIVARVVSRRVVSIPETGEGDGN